jgi:hypothetical protein
MNAVPTKQRDPLVTESRTYNTRMQPTSVTAATARSGSLILGTAYCANPNGTGDCTGNAGNVIQAKITPPGASPAKSGTWRRGWTTLGRGICRPRRGGSQARILLC